TAMALSQMDAEGRGESLVDPTSSSLTFYEKGAWALILLREQVGDQKFSKGVKAFLEAHPYGNVTVQDFLSKMEQVSGQSLSDFRRNWLEAKTFPREAALDYLLSRSPSIKQYIGLQKLASGQQADFGTIRKAWKAHAESAYREHLIRDYRELFNRPFLDTLFLEGSLPVSKTLLVTTQTIEPWMVPLVEAWLDAPSYDLREAALFRLWVVNPPERRKYLDRISENGSLADIGLKQLWWLLSLLTEAGVEPETKKAYLQGLRETTGAAYSWEIRQNAFSMLHEVGALDGQNILDLIQSTEHHSWQYRKFARNLFETLLQDNGGREILWEIARTLPREDYPYVYEKLEQS
ncbi:MAG: M1 family aminopeptidase, partial [Robiginitalea sp.]